MPDPDIGTDAEFDRYRDACIATGRDWRRPMSSFAARRLEIELEYGYNPTFEEEMDI